MTANPGGLEGTIGYNWIWTWVAVRDRLSLIKILQLCTIHALTLISASEKLRAFVSPFFIAGYAER
jgi:hypothetical protein